MLSLLGPQFLFSCHCISGHNLGRCTGSLRCNEQCSATYVHRIQSYLRKDSRRSHRLSICIWKKDGVEQHTDLHHEAPWGHCLHDDLYVLSGLLPIFFFLLWINVARELELTNWNTRSLCSRLLNRDALAWRPARYAAPLLSLSAPSLGMFWNCSLCCVMSYKHHLFLAPKLVRVCCWE